MPQYDVVVELPGTLDPAYASVRQFICENADTPIHQRFTAYWRAGAFWMPEGERFLWSAHGARGLGAGGEMLSLDILPTSRGPMLVGNFGAPAAHTVHAGIARAVSIWVHALLVLVLVLSLTQITKQPLRVFLCIGVVALFYRGLRWFRRTLRVLSVEERAEQRQLILSQLRQLGPVTLRQEVTGAS